MPEQQDSGKARAAGPTERQQAAAPEATAAAPIAEPKYPIEITATREQLEALRAKLRRSR